MTKGGIVVKFLNTVCLFLIVAGIGLGQQTRPQKKGNVGKKSAAEEAVSREKARRILEQNPHWAAYVKKFDVFAAPTARDRVLLAPLEEDRAKFSTFLAQKDTGLFRIHDIGRCGTISKGVVNANCTWDVIGKGASYSFRKGDYTFGLYNDIQLRDGKIETYGLNFLGFLTDLGDLDINRASLLTDGIRQLTEFVPSSEKATVIGQINFVKNGFVVNNHVYRSRLDAKPNSTYALRAIAYNSLWTKEFRDLVNEVFGEDKRTDVIVVFRIVRKHDDGSVTISWKKLREITAPILVG